MASFPEIKKSREEDTILQNMGGYSQELRETLCKHGLSWYADNPCVSAEKLEEYIENNFSEKQFKFTLDKAKHRIETDVGRFTLDGKPRKMKNDPKYPELRCLILGKVGQGKSSLGNLLTGEDGFKVFDTVKTGTRGSHYARSKENNIQVIDTQGFADCDDGDVDLEMSKIFNIYHKGIHAFIFAMDLSNPRISAEDVHIFKTLEETFGNDILNYTFLVLTKAESFFSNKNKNKKLKDYLSEMKETALAEALSVIGDNVIAVENKCESYQKELTRQAVLDLISDSVSRSANGCYTHELFQKAEEEKMKKQDRIEALRKEQKELIEAMTLQSLKEKMSILKCQNDLIKIDMDNEHLIGEVHEHVKYIKVEGMSDKALEQFVRENAKRILKDLVVEELKKRMSEVVKSEVTNPKKDVDSYIEELKEAYPLPFNKVGELYVKSQVRQKVLELKDIQRDIDAKQSAKKKAQQEKICIFILRHINLFDQSHTIQEMLKMEEGEFLGEDVKLLIEECMESKKVRNEIKKEEERRTVVLKEKEDDVQVAVKQLINEQLQEVTNIKDVVKMVNVRRFRVLDELYRKVKYTINIEWMSTEKHKEFIRQIAEKVLENLVDEELMERVIQQIDIAVTDPMVGVDYYVQKFKRSFPDVAVRIKEPFIRSEVRRRVLELSDDLHSLRENESRDAEKRKARTEKISAFILDHISLFDKPQKIHEMLAEKSDEFRGEEVIQLIEECLEGKEVRRKIKKEEKERLEAREDQEKSLTNKVEAIIQEELSKAEEMKEVTTLTISGKNAFLDLVYNQVEGSLKTDWMSSEEQKVWVNKITEKVMFELVDENLKYRIAQHIKADVTDPNVSVDDYVQQIKNTYACATMRVGEAYIRSEVRQQMFAVKQSAQEEGAKEATRKKAQLGKVCDFILDHIDLFDDSKAILEKLAEKGEEYREGELRQMIEDCLQDARVRDRIRIYKEEQREIRVREALKCVSECAEKHVANFICKKSHWKLRVCVKDPIKAEGYINRLAKNVELELGTKIGNYLTFPEVQAVVHDVFTFTIDNIYDASFIDKAKMIFKPLLTLNRIKKVMTPFVKTTAKLLPLVLL